jgi:hypothetical protein
MARSERGRRRRLAIVLPAILLTPLFLACNALVGLDAFDKVACVRDCDGGADSADVLLPDVQGDASSEGGDDGAIEAAIPIPEGASPTSWARWPMPNPKDGGGLLGSEFSYAKNADNSVTDLRTNLVWGLVVGAAQAASFDQALKYCRDYSTDAGATGWRLPTRIELVTLIDFTRVNPAIDGAYFPVPAGWYWTSSVVRPPTLPYRFWAVDFGSGAVSDNPPAGARNILCVKGT